MTSQSSIQSFTDTANSGIQHFAALADIVLSASEQLIDLNLNAARSAYEFASSNASPLNSGKDIQEQISNRVAASGRGFEKAASYLRSVNEICARTQVDVIELNVRHAGSYAQSIQSMFDSVAKLSPGDAFAFTASALPTTARSSRKAA